MNCSDMALGYHPTSEEDGGVVPRLYWDAEQWKLQPSMTMCWDTIEVPNVSIEPPRIKRFATGVWRFYGSSPNLVSHIALETANNTTSISQEERSNISYISERAFSTKYSLKKSTYYDPKCSVLDISQAPRVNQRNRY